MFQRFQEGASIFIYFFLTFGSDFFFFSFMMCSSGVFWIQHSNQVNMTPNLIGKGHIQGHASKHPGVPHVHGSFCYIYHINSRKTAVIQFAPSKSPRLFNSSRPITDTKCWRLSPLSVHCTHSDIGRWLCYESGCWLRCCTKGLTVEPETGWSDCLTRPSTVRDPAVLSVQCCYSATLIFDHRVQMNNFLESNTDKPSVSGKTKLRRAAAWLGLVC